MGAASMAFSVAVDRQRKRPIKPGSGTGDQRGMGTKSKTRKKTGSPRPRVPPAFAKTVEADNEVTRYHLVRQMRTPLGVIPFVGAGMSAKFKFPQWGDVLLNAADTEGASVRARVGKHLNAGEFEDAAEILRSRGEDNFQRRIEKEFGRAPDEAELAVGPLTLLPHLSSGPVITTNFDHALESVFRLGGVPFQERIL